MSNRMSRVPSYRCKNVSGRRYGCVSLPDGIGSRRDILLGLYGTKESRAEYVRVISEWEAAGRTLPHTDAINNITINELILAFWPYAQKHYRSPDGMPTSELGHFR